ncbi:hypothetical protein P7C71_g3387, partial [Lecanoromycetidae sp. Uapishka_2]
MSDSSLSDGLPSDATLERALRSVVQKVYKSGKLEELTVKRIRKSAEGELDLQDGFFKNNSAWKERSKDIIQSEVDTHTEANASSQQAPSSPPITKQLRAPPAKPQNQQRKAQATKRASVQNDGSRKRRKKEDGLDRDDQAGEAEKVPSKKPVTEVQKRSYTSSMSPPPKEEEKEGEIHVNGKYESKQVKAEQSESEMSEVFDEAPKPKKRGRTSGSPKPKAQAKKAGIPKVKKASEEPTDPDVEEIKRLQSWLVKCGIRKMWYKELAAYDTPKAKIRHLKNMLADVGMTGRYSAEKANQIKEERELKADLEAVQEGNQKWGKTSEEEEATTDRPKRRLPKGLEGLDFLNDSDGEETD